jgi:hypothetical protein
LWSVIDTRTTASPDGTARKAVVVLAVAITTGMNASGWAGWMENLIWAGLVLSIAWVWGNRTWAKVVGARLLWMLWTVAMAALWAHVEFVARYPDITGVNTYLSFLMVIQPIALALYAFDLGKRLALEVFQALLVIVVAQFVYTLIGTLLPAIGMWQTQTTTAGRLGIIMAVVGFPVALHLPTVIAVRRLIRERI